MLISCCINECPSKSSNESESRASLFVFPVKNPNLFNLWVDATKPHFRKEFSSKEKIYICQNHFEDNCLHKDDIEIWKDGVKVLKPRKKVRLTKNAVPSIFNVPGESSNKKVLEPSTEPRLLAAIAEGNKHSTKNKNVSSTPPSLVPTLSNENANFEISQAEPIPATYTMDNLVQDWHKKPKNTLLDKWGMVDLPTGLVLFAYCDESTKGMNIKRSVLVEKDMSTKLKVRGRDSTYRTLEKISCFEDITFLLKKVACLRVCEDISCRNGIFQPKPHSSNVRCRSCQILKRRKDERERVNRKRLLARKEKTKKEMKNIKQKNRRSVKKPSYFIKSTLTAFEEAELNQPGSKKRILLLGSRCPGEMENCPFCSRSFKNQRQLKTHCSKKCFNANTSLSTKGQHDTGVNGMQNDRIVKWQLSCPNCGDIFASRKEKQEHLKIHPPHVCDRCGKMYADKTIFRSHQQTHNETCGFICEVCGSAFKTDNALRNHMHHHEDGQWMCDKCPKIFKSTLFLNRHLMKVHFRRRIVSCTECKKSFSSKVLLDQHYRLVHLGLKPYQCVTCLKVFGRSDYVRKHRCPGEAIDENSGTFMKYVKRLPCKICGKYYNGTLKLKLHVETHLKTKRFPCKLCRLTFSNSGNLHRHTRQHTSYENMLRCNVCWKKMDTKEELEDHMLQHNNPRYRCDKCNKPFHRKYLLHNHMMAEHLEAEAVRLGDEFIYRNLLDVSSGELIEPLLLE